MTVAKLHRLVPDRERVKRSDAALAARLIDGMDYLPQELRHTMRRELFRAAEPDTSRSPWGKYTMLSVAQVGAIWQAIRELERTKPEERPQEMRHARPHEVRHVLDLAFLHLRQDTGEIMLTRDEIAERSGITPQNVSKAMTVLANLGVVIKGDLRKVAGMKGRGMRPYFINPHAAWNGTVAGAVEEAKRQEPPLLRLMKGGKD